MKSIILYNIIYKFLAIKHDTIQYMLVTQKQGHGGERVIGNVEDSTAASNCCIIIIIMTRRQLRSVATTLHDDRDPVPSSTPV